MAEVYWIRKEDHIDVFTQVPLEDPLWVSEFKENAA